MHIINQNNNLFQSFFWKKICKLTDRIVFEKTLSNRTKFYAWLEPPQKLLYKNLHRYYWLLLGLVFSRIVWRDFPCDEDLKKSPDILSELHPRIFQPFSLLTGRTLLEIPLNSPRSKYLQYTLDIKNPETIIGNLDKNTRNKIKQGNQKLKAKWLELDEVNKYHSLLLNQRKNSKLGLPPFFLEKRLFDISKNNNPSEFIKVLGVTNTNNELEAAMTLIGYQNIGYEFGLARKNDSNNRSFAGDFLKYSAFLELSKKDIQLYNFGELNNDSANEKEKNINSFKQKWKGYTKELLLIR